MQLSSSLLSNWRSLKDNRKRTAVLLKKAQKLFWSFSDNWANESKHDTDGPCETALKYILKIGQQ